MESNSSSTVDSTDGIEEKVHDAQEWKVEATGVIKVSFGGIAN